MALTERERRALLDRRANPQPPTESTDHNDSNRIFKDWDDFFTGIIGKPLEHPKNVELYIMRLIPATHPYNQLGIDTIVPYLLGMTDEYGDRWLFTLYDDGVDGKGWKFITFKPDRQLYLNYLKGEDYAFENGLRPTTLLDLFRSGKHFYRYVPEVLEDLVPIDVQEIPKHIIPYNDSTFNHDLWLDPGDLEYGMNRADTPRIMRKAQRDEF